MNDFDIQYKDLVNSILNTGVEEFNQRTGKHVKILAGGYHAFHLDLNQGFPLLSLRDINIKNFIAEVLWFIAGSQDLNLLREFSKAWNLFSDYDNPDKVSNAYGHMWRKYFGRDQLQLVIDELARDPSSRQCVVVGWNPAEDALGTTKKPNVPCVPMFMVNIIDNKLNLTTVWRSEDVYFGLPHDVTGFALLQMIIAQKLNVGLGYLHHIINHAHIYDNQFENCEILVQRESQHPPIKFELPENVYDRSQVWNPELVQEMIEIISSQYSPQEKLKHVKVAV